MLECASDLPGTVARPGPTPGAFAKRADTASEPSPKLERPRASASSRQRHAPASEHQGRKGNEGLPIGASPV